MHLGDARNWAIETFGGSDLGHGARVKRAIAIGADLVSSPAASLPKACPGDRAKRAYELLSNKHVTHAGLLSGPMKQAAAACAKEATVLLVQDTTTVAVGGRKRRDGLGPINDAEGAQGMLVHTCLALAESGRVLGVLDQQAWARSATKHSREETTAARKQRPRESERWRNSARAAHERLSNEADCPRIIHVADRESDIYELFVECDTLDDSFVFRATYDRSTIEQRDGDPVGSLSAAEDSPALVCKVVQVPARPGKPARTARLDIRAARVEILPPLNLGRKGKTIWMNVVIVSEIDPPSKKDALRWNLLTREPIETAVDVLRVADIYSRRWTIEDFHMGLKTGCAIEERQLESFAALSNFLAFASAIATHSLQIRDAARAPETRPATDVLTDIQLKLLKRAVPRLAEHCTAHQALRAIAVLGGFYDSSKKTQPGWRTLYGGMQRLLEREAGYLDALAELQAAAGSS